MVSQEQSKVLDEAEDLDACSPQRFWDAVAQEKLLAALTKESLREELDFVKAGPAAGSRRSSRSGRT